MSRLRWRILAVYHLEVAVLVCDNGCKVITDIGFDSDWIDLYNESTGSNHNQSYIQDGGQ